MKNCLKTGSFQQDQAGDQLGADARGNQFSIDTCLRFSPISQAKKRKTTSPADPCKAMDSVPRSPAGTQQDKHAKGAMNSCRYP
jgi:hypothetical protein